MDDTGVNCWKTPPVPLLAGKVVILPGIGEHAGLGDADADGDGVGVGVGVGVRVGDGVGDGVPHEPSM